VLFSLCFAYATTQLRLSIHQRIRNNSLLPLHATEWAPTQSSLATSSDCQSRRSALDAARCPRRVSRQKPPLSLLLPRQRPLVERTTVQAGLLPLSRLLSTTTTHRRPSARCVDNYPSTSHSNLHYSMLILVSFVQVARKTNTAALPSPQVPS
jgi:hypothetical protein